MAGRVFKQLQRVRCKPVPNDPSAFDDDLRSLINYCRVVGGAQEWKQFEKSKLRFSFDQRSQIFDSATARLADQLGRPWSISGHTAKSNQPVRAISRQLPLDSATDSIGALQACGRMEDDRDTLKIHSVLHQRTPLRSRFYFVVNLKP